MEERKVVRMEKIAKRKWDSYDWLIALRRAENKWFDEQVNAISTSNKEITIENIRKAGGKELISENSILVKDGYIAITDRDELPVLTAKGRLALDSAIKSALSWRSEYHRKLYAEDIKRANKLLTGGF